MATKPLDQLSPAYRRRIERAMAKGKSRQAARGHKPQEHIARAIREIEAEGLTKAQQRTVFDWASRRSFIVKDHDFEPIEVVELAKDNGYEWFTNYRTIWNAARLTYVKEVRNGTYASRGMGYLTDLTERSNAPELSWLYYH